MMQVETFIFGPFSVNSYLVYDKESSEALVLDPGNMDPYEDKILYSAIEENNLKLKYLIATHSHIDHLFGVNCIKQKYNPVFIGSEYDMPLLQNASGQGRLFGLNILPVIEPDEFFNEEKEITVGTSTGKFIFTPGHTPGEYCLYFEHEKFLFSGDVLFRETIGRTDLWGGNTSQLLDSINNKLLKLPEDVEVYPGHGELTTIAHEKRHNIYIRS